MVKDEDMSPEDKNEGAVDAIELVGEGWKQQQQRVEVLDEETKVSLTSLDSSLSSVGTSSTDDKPLLSNSMSVDGHLEALSEYCLR